MLMSMPGSRIFQMALAACLIAFLPQASTKAEEKEESAAKPRANVVDDFESGLPLGTDRSGIPVGFIKFGDRGSVVRISATSTPPEGPGDAARENALRVDLNVQMWAGFAHFFQNDAADIWVSYDWSGFDALSFWLYGNNTGTALFVDVLDNRNRCSSVDDAERYVYNFKDDFSGWRLITVPFAGMVRKEVGNGAPKDGLNLSEVHGWAFGARSTGGPKTYYIDSVHLRSTSPDKKDAAIGAQQPDYPINELPMYGLCEKTADQKRADEKFIKQMTQRFQNRTDAADYFARVGWNAFYKGDRSLAIKRFNQAWLLNSKNQLALWGFAAISRDRGQVKEAAHYFRLAIDNGPENSNLRRDYEDTLRRLEQQP